MREARRIPSSSDTERATAWACPTATTGEAQGMESPAQVTEGGQGNRGSSDGEGGEGDGDGEGGNGEGLAAARGLGGVNREPFIIQSD